MFLYPPRDGRLELVAIEYLVHEVEAEGHPELFGQPFDGPMAGHNALQERHMWLFNWASNPAGTFARYHPDVHRLPK